MKYFLVFIAAAALTVSGCNKCYECNMGTPQAPDVREYCKDDFEGDKDLFETTIEEYQLAGYECSQK